MAGNAVIGALRVDLGINTAQFEDGLKRARAGLSGFGAAAGPAFAGVAAAAAAVGAAVGAGVKNALDRADELGKIAQKAGGSVKGISELAYAGDLADVSLDQLATGLKKLSVNMTGVADGGAKPAAAAFAKLGLSVTDTAGRLKAPDALFAEIAGKFGDMDDGARKTALAVALFGKSGADLIPLLNSGSDGLRDMAAEAAQLGLVIDEQTSSAAETFNDNLTTLGKVGTGITTQLAAQLAPTMASFSSVLVDAAKNTALLKQAGDILGGTLKGLVTVGVVVGAALKVAFDGAVATAGAASLVVQGKFAQAFETYKKGVTSTVDTVKGTVGVIAKIWDGADAAVVGHTKKLTVEKTAVEASGKAHKTRGAAISDAAKAQQRASDHADDYIAGLQREAAELGKTRAELILMRAEEEAAAAPTQAQKDRILELARAAALAAASMADFNAQMSRVEKPEKLPDTLDPAPTLDEKALEKPAETLRRSFDEAFDAVGSGFDQLFYSLKNRNWVGAAQGLINAIDAIKNAQGVGGKIGAVAGLATAAGNAIGGVAGSGLAGAAGGALAGFSVAGPVGAAVGAVIGGIAGIFGGSSAKKKEEAERKRQEAEAAAARATQIATEKRNLEIELIRIQQGDTAALIEQRKDELAAARALDPALADLKQQMYDAQDAADAAARAQALADTRRQLEIALMEAQGKAADALAAQRQLELDATDESLRGLKQAAFAAQDVMTQRQLEIQIMEASGDAAGALAAQRALELAATDESMRGLKLTLWQVQDAAKDAADALALSNARRSYEADILDLAGDKIGALAIRREQELSKLAPALQTFQRLSYAAQDAAASRDKFQGFADGIADVMKNLGGATGQTLGDVAERFRQAGVRARFGDETAYGDLQSLAPDAANAVRDNAASAVDAARGIANIRATLRAAQTTALDQVSVAQQELDRLALIASNMANVDVSATTIKDTVAALHEAQGLALEQEVAQSTTLTQLLGEVQGLRADTQAAAASAEQLGLAIEAHTFTAANVLDGASRPNGTQLNTAPVEPA